MRVILNDDCTWYFDRFIESRTDLTPDPELPRQYVRQYKDSGMTDYFINIFGQYSFTPTKVVESLCDVYELDHMGDIPVNFKNIARCTAAYNYMKAGIDVFGLMIDECKKIGIRPWISVRMNDVHCSRKDSPHGEGLRSMFLHTAHERGLMRDSHRDIFGYYDETLDYGKEEVRRYFLDYIHEQLLQYDVCGIELDFMREVYCFRFGYEDEGRGIMREFMKEVRKSCKEAERLHGHPVKIAVRCLTDPLNDRYSGLYALDLAREGLVDLLIPSPRWETSYDRVPIDMWKELVGDKCEVIAAYEVAHCSCSRKRVRRRDEQLFGMWHKDYCMGADGVYLYNNIYLYNTFDERHVELYKILSDPKKVAAMPRRNTVSYQDISAPGFQAFSELPLSLNTLYYNTLYIETGSHDGKMYLLFDAGADEDVFTVYANSSSVKYLGKTYVETDYTPNPVLVYELDVIRPITQAIEIKTRKAGLSVIFAEIRTEKPKLL